MNTQLKKFWIEKSNLIIWKIKPKKVLNYKKYNYKDWFPDAKLNIYENCISANLKKGLSKKTALITVDANKQIKKYTFEEIDDLVNNFCLNVKEIFKDKNLSKKKIMIHSSASIYSSIAMLTCSKLGIHFSVIFEDLQLEAINNRIKIFKPDIFISRWNYNIFFKKFPISKLLNIKFHSFQDIIFSKKKIKKNKITYFKSNKSLFTLFTSGSTGKPKGIEHSSGGYLLYAKLTCIQQFGMNSNSVVLTASDAGWINGHTYALYGPLSLGATTILLESPMILLDKILLKKILKLNVTILYLPVTLIRLMKALFNKVKFNYKSLKTLGSMGEPLAPSVGKWFAVSFNLQRKAIINTYFQTETGGIVASPKYTDSSKQVPHGSVGKMIDKKIKIYDLNKNKNEIIIKSSWPGCMKNVINGKKEWNKYWNSEGNFRMFDLATLKNKNIYVHGRVDDVINIRGHRIGSEEIESVVLKIKDIHECCAVLVNEDLEGAVIQLFVVSKKDNLDKIIEDKIYSNFGSYALPKKIYYLSDLPKTRSGKILRRLLREIINTNKPNYTGDISTMINPKIIDEIKNKIKK